LPPRVFCALPSGGAPPVGPVAQWLEPAAHNGLVAGSSPARPTSQILEITLFISSGNIADMSEACARKVQKGHIRDLKWPPLASNRGCGLWARNTFSVSHYPSSAEIGSLGESGLATIQTWSGNLRCAGSSEG
jgi:hypothetical protein